MTGAKPKRLLRALAGETSERPPWWLMRQAGRYLPEYRALRAQAEDFIGFCLNPKLAAEATLQPIRRFGMDAAILFSDILLIPRALGQKVGFRGDGPALEAIVDDGALAGLSLAGLDWLSPVYETAERVRRDLPEATALIGFAGAPWTVATYMVEGGSSRDFARVKFWAYRHPDSFDRLMRLIEEATIAFLLGQIEAGVEVVQLFDSWAGVLPEPAFARWVIAPARRITAAVKARFPDCPVIGFPRGAGLLYQRYVGESGVTAVGVDTTVPLAHAAALQRGMPVQGNLDPVALAVGGEALVRAVGDIRDALRRGPHIFNLGHGVLPQTPPEHVAVLAQLLAA
ncbi:MAG TPA: uroporphyrinogen decarboxylase [Stellaceae bacterium]